jgi:hypothetical protein
MPGSRRKSSSVKRQVPPGNYTVGKYWPPVETQWRPGESGNPSGRPKGRLNLATEVADALNNKVTIRDGDKERKLSLPAANILAHGIKGAKGDARSTALFLQVLTRLNFFEEQSPDYIQKAVQDYRQSISPGDGLLEGLDADLLSRDEQIEMSCLIEVIDDDIAGLSSEKFERFKLLRARLSVRTRFTNAQRLIGLNGILNWAPVDRD